MKSAHPQKALRPAVIAAIVLGLVTPSAFGARIDNIRHGNWSDPSIWNGGVPPGAADNAVFPPRTIITYDPAAAGAVGSIEGNSFTLTLARDLEVQDLFGRESTIADGGFNLTVRGTLSNWLPNGNGGSRTARGGNLFLNNLTLQRTSQYVFYPGDTIRGNYDTSSIFGTWPEITVNQDPQFYDSRLGQGLSFDGDAATIKLGRTSATSQAKIILKWDPNVQGPIDWTLRWKGNRATELRNYYANGQLVVASQPTSRTFNPTDNIFFDSTTGYTYVGFKAHAAPDGVQINGSGFAAFDGMYVWAGLFDASNPSHLVTFNAFGPITKGAFLADWATVPKKGTYTVSYYINANNSPMLQPVDPPTSDPCWVTTIGPESYVKYVQLNTADIVDKCRSLPGPSRNNEPSALNGVYINGSGFGAFDGMYVWAGLFDASNPSHLVTFNAFGPINNGAFLADWVTVPKKGTYTVSYYINANNSPMLQPVDPPTSDPCWVTTIGPESYVKNVQLNTADIVDQCRSLPVPSRNNEPSARAWSRP